MIKELAPKKNFLDLTEKLTDLTAAQIVLLPVSFDLTASYQKGTRFAPKAVIEASHFLELYDIETNTEVYQKGIHTAPICTFQTSQEMFEKLEDLVHYYLKKEKFVVTIGGEHSISFPCIKAHMEHFGKMSVLQLDAHTDLDPALDGNPYSHGSVIARIKEITNVDKLVAAGIRSMSKVEEKYLFDQTTVYAHDIHISSNWIDTIIDSLGELTYITFDLDVFDPSLMPATGTPEPGGLFWHQIFSLLQAVVKHKKVIGFDLVELMPIESLVASDFTCAKAIYKLLSYIFKEEK